MTSIGEARPVRADMTPFRVLVVEDDLDLLLLLEDIFIAAGYAVVTAKNGAEAMAALIAEPEEGPHAVVLDLGLPVENGVTVLSFLRTALHSTLPVVVLTGRDEPEVEEALRGLGISGYLSKPVIARRLLGTVAGALGLTVDS